jgi:hypothetical protein
MTPPKKSSKKSSSAGKKSTSRAQVVHNQYVSVDTLNAAEMKDYFKYLSSFKSIFWINFLAGTARGLGFVIGTVVVIAILTFVVSQVLSEVPWIGEMFRWLDDWLQQNLSSY